MQTGKKKVNLKLRLEGRKRNDKHQTPRNVGQPQGQRTTNAWLELSDIFLERDACLLQSNVFVIHSTILLIQLIGRQWLEKTNKQKEQTEQNFLCCFWVIEQIKKKGSLGSVQCSLGSVHMSQDRCLAAKTETAENWQGCRAAKKKTLERINEGHDKS